MKSKIQETIFRLEDKKLKFITTFISIVMLAIFLCTLIFQTDFLYAIFWVFISIYFVFDLINITHWDYDGEKLNKNESNRIIRSFRDITAITIFISGLIYLITIYFEMIDISISYNNYLIIIVYILLTASHIFNNFAISNAKKEMENLVDKMYNKIKK